MLYKEIIYMCLDEIKANSDDNFITEEHVKFLLGKFRATLLYQTYKDIKKEIPESNYTTICLDLEETNAIDGEPCTGGTYLRSIQEVPNTMTIGTSYVYPTDYFQGNITLVSRNRLKFVGHNKYLKNIIYTTIGVDNHLYFKSNNPQHKYLEKVKFTGIFEDIDKALELSCDDSDTCDYLEKTFPIEETLVPLLIQSVVKEVLGTAYRPADSVNNSTDDLSDLIAWARRNMKSGLQKQIENGE